MSVVGLWLRFLPSPEVHGPKTRSRGSAWGQEGSFPLQGWMTEKGRTQQAGLAGPNVGRATETGRSDTFSGPSIGRRWEGAVGSRRR